MRFVTEYLTEIRAGEVQTNVGVVNLPEPYVGERLHHKDKILFLGRQIEKGRFEGSISKISAAANFSFREHQHILSVPDNSKEEPETSEGQEYM